MTRDPALMYFIQGHNLFLLILHLLKGNYISISGRDGNRFVPHIPPSHIALWPWTERLLLPLICPIGWRAVNMPNIIMTWSTQAAGSDTEVISKKVSTADWKCSNPYTEIQDQFNWGKVQSRLFCLSAEVKSGHLTSAAAEPHDTQSNNWTSNQAFLVMTHLQFVQILQSSACVWMIHFNGL